MLSERLKELRKRDGLSQVEFAKQFNISTGTIGNWETGAREPDATTLMKIAKFFNVTVDYLLNDDEKNAPPQSDEAFEPELTEKDELDISRRLDAMLSDLDKSDSALMFDGEPLDDESRALLIESLESSIRLAKLINKRKYTPKKYRKGTANDRDSDTPQG